MNLEPGKPWGRGLCDDVKTTVGTHWVSEMTNFNQKTVAVSLLMFITVIAPTLTFGAVYGTNTNNAIGAVETILATCWVGVFMSFFSGMPTVRIAVTTSGSSWQIVSNMASFRFDIHNRLSLDRLGLY